MSTRKNSDRQHSAPRFEAPTISIYQNGDYVSGILQQIHGQPLLVDFSSQESHQSSDSSDKGKGANASLKGGANIPAVGNIELKIGADYDKRLKAHQSLGSTATHNWQYTQAYYLYAARAALKANGLIREIGNRSDAESLEPGDLVEYTATFSPSQLIAILDIVTPDLVSAIARKITHDKGMKEFQGGSPETVQAFKLKLDSKVQSSGEMAFAATAATKIDFRSETTREFYGHIGDKDPVTAVTICDLAHFIVADEDRILDGEFKVLGKVTSRVELDVPILARNKVLDRLNPESVDELVELLNQEVISQTQNFLDKESEEEEDEGPIQAAKFDFSLDSRVAGPSFNVVPIAIYV
ncbi:DUF6414 family protein [Glutamicibacter ardleyensis]|uniref:DUF6414 family protein n=1 Tax=Glutamicibacter ardleyensis TaxID=225894 RepID=UPI003FD0BD3E